MCIIFPASILNICVHIYTRFRIVIISQCRYTHTHTHAHMLYSISKVGRRFVEVAHCCTITIYMYIHFYKRAHGLVDDIHVYTSTHSLFGEHYLHSSRHRCCCFCFFSSRLQIRSTPITVKMHKLIRVLSLSRQGKRRRVFRL